MKIEVGAVADMIRSQFFIDDTEELALMKSFEKFIATKYHNSKFKQVIMFLHEVDNKTDSFKFLIKLIPMDTLIYFNNTVDGDRISITIEQNIFNGKIQYIVKGYTGTAFITSMGIIIKLEIINQVISVEQIKLPNIENAYTNTLKEYYEWTSLKASMDVKLISSIYEKLEQAGIEVALWYIIYNRTNDESKKILGYLIGAHHLSDLSVFKQLTIIKNEYGEIKLFHLRPYSLFNDFYGRNRRFLIKYKLYDFWQFLHNRINSPASSDYIGKNVIIDNNGRKYIFDSNNAYMVAYVYIMFYTGWRHGDVAVNICDSDMYTVSSKCDLSTIGINDLTVVKEGDNIVGIEQAIYDIITERLKED